MFTSLASRYCITVFIILIFLSGGVSAQDDSGGPFKIGLSLNSPPGNISVVLAIQCTSYVGLAQGEISLKLSKDTVKIPGSSDHPSLQEGRIVLWSDKSDEKFTKEFTYEFTLPIGEKAFVDVVFKGTDVKYGRSISVRERLFMHQTAEGIVTSPASFADLSHREIMMEQKQKGYDQLSDKEIKSIDPEFFKKKQDAFHPPGAVRTETVGESWKKSIEPPDSIAQLRKQKENILKPDNPKKPSKERIPKYDTTSIKKEIKRERKKP